MFRNEVKLGKQPMKVVDRYVYLRVVLTPSVSFALAQRTLYNKSLRSMYCFNPFTPKGT